MDAPVIIAVVLLSITFVQCLYNEPACLNAKGECLLTSACPSGSQKSGLCPTQAYNVKCCVPYNEDPCEYKSGRCQWKNHACDGLYSSGLCPTQAAGVLCCVQNSNCPEKYSHALQKMFKFEGKCQNWREDSGNYFEGRLGYTCMGVTPGVGWNNRYLFDNCGGYTSYPALFVKYCYDRNPSSFKKGVEKLYIKNYLSVCDKLADPAFFVCGDISLNSGPGRVKTFMSELGSPGNDIKGYARRLNQLHRDFYIRITRRNPEYQRFIAGWLQRADERDSYINNYTCN
ncbi:uncharacterized protein LOC130636528 [Hydractinia symbiolongicarpus]|uniref:uncharacterized protein LOC130636528 n=1 Tax=Hydractinia symbiolongicarpus TaxID=13093 RepID=UPI00254E1354|nr:uncharacterized protein LOC130636528 [Hydractinia symbiolongicarpus]